jgi:hypothetical protein
MVKIFSAIKAGIFLRALWQERPLCGGLTPYRIHVLHP